MAQLLWLARPSRIGSRPGQKTDGPVQNNACRVTQGYVPFRAHCEREDRCSGIHASRVGMHQVYIHDTTSQLDCTFEETHATSYYVHPTSPLHHSRPKARCIARLGPATFLSPRTYYVRFHNAGEKARHVRPVIEPVDPMLRRHGKCLPGHPRRHKHHQALQHV